MSQPKRPWEFPADMEEKAYIETGWFDMSMVPPTRPGPDGRPEYQKELPMIQTTMTVVTYGDSARFDIDMSAAMAQAHADNLYIRDVHTHVFVWDGTPHYVGILILSTYK